MWRERRFSGISVTKSANEGTFGGSVAGLFSDSYASNITEQSVWTSLNNHPRIMIHEKTSRLLQPNDKKILFLVLDGLGGLPRPETGKTEIETANIPNLDGLAGASSGGRAQIVDPGVTPGSGPAHLALFGYHPFQVEFGRGALEALGSEFDMQSDDLAARGNFATLKDSGNVNSVVLDRRAGRPRDDECKRLCEKLHAGLRDNFKGCQIFLLPGKEHRFTVVFRGAGLAAGLNDNDPQRENKPLVPIRPAGAEDQHAASLVNDFLQSSLEILADETPTSSGKIANGMLLRGFSMLPDLQPFHERYGVRAGAIAAYPMYRGVANLVGMEVLGTPSSWEEELTLLEEKWKDHDFFFVHFKNTDTAGHSGLFDEKVRALETLDASIPRLRALDPEVLVITGDHSTPCIHKEHSWHPVPTLIHSPLALPGPNDGFSERALMASDLGVFPATQLMVLALAHASRLNKFGA